MLNHTDRVLQRLEKMASYSDMENGIYRAFCSDSASRLYKELKQWCKNDNVTSSVDALANLRIRSKNYDPQKPTFIIASHVDSVINAGKYDGPLGFLIAIEILLYAEHHIKDLHFNIEAIGFGDEEGSRFNTTYLGSSAIAGCFQDSWLYRRDGDDITLMESLVAFDRDDVEMDNCRVDKLIGYYEVHIEQGPVLEQKNLAVGQVSHIYGQTRVNVDIMGHAGHAGTVPMDMRKDAFAGLAEFTTAMESYALAHKEDLVATIGTCQVGPGSTNVIPGHVSFSIDLRSHSLDILSTAEYHIQGVLDEIVKKRGLDYKWTLMQKNKPTYCDEDLNKTLAEAIAVHQSEMLTLPSGAGHDAVMISRVAPVSMLFVRCKDGISHHPSESVMDDDIEKALNVSFTFIEKLNSLHE